MIRNKFIGILVASAIIAMHMADGFAAQGVVYGISELAKCSDRKSDISCGYFKATYQERGTVNQLVPGYEDAQSCCNRGGDTDGTCDNCLIPGTNMCFANGTGHDDFLYCSDTCVDYGGYDAYVIDITNTTWGCACEYPNGFVEWRDYKTGVLKRYTRRPSTSARGCVDVALDEYKCAPGYYGPNNSLNGCQACPANATCNGGTYFICKSGYYENDTKTGCIKCPDSKEGGLGWDENGNGVPAINGDQLDWCSIESGTVLYDATGTFIVDPNYDYSEGCEYTK